MKPLALFLLTIVPCFGLITSTSVGGDWNTGSTWVGGMIPGDGDTAVIAPGALVTITGGTPVTLGTGSGDALLLNQGTLILNDNLTLKGSMKVVTDATLTQNGTSTITFWTAT